MNLVIFGPPGSGKGTQSERIARHYGMTHLSTGDALRQAIRNRTEVGLRAKAVMEKGELVSDEIVNGVLREIIGQKRGESDGFLFDGYPRNIEQARQLDTICGEFSLSHPSVMNLDVPEENLLLRLTGRRICGQCKATYNIHFQPTRQAGVCDECSGPLIKRADDEPDTVRERLRVYKEESAPVLDYYGELGRLHTLDAAGDSDQVFEKITSIIEENR